MKRLIIFFFIFLILGCATTSRLSSLKLDMTKADVDNVMGEPNCIRGAIYNKWRQYIEVWEYFLIKDFDDWFYGNRRTYWLYFCDGELVQWGEPQDWKKESDRIYEMRFR